MKEFYNDYLATSDNDYGELLGTKEQFIKINLELIIKLEKIQKILLKN